jgi:uncharacterized protein (TIGR02996 family)
MTHFDAFLHAILDAPDDDAPRLICADWLEEHGDPRGEFIRVQCALARLAVEDPNRPALALREVELRDRHERRLLVGKVRRWAEGWTMQRGFVEAVAIDADLFLARAEKLLAAAPVQTVKLNATPPVVHQLADCPHLARLSGLQLHANYLGDDGLRVLLRSPHLLRLRYLHLGLNRLTNDGAAVVAACPALAGLKVLHLGHNAIGAAGARALADSEYLQRLHELHLEDNPVGNAGAQALMRPGRLPELRLLNLTQFNPLEIYSRALHLPGRAAIATAEPHVLADLQNSCLLDTKTRQSLRDHFGDRVRIS